MMKLLNSLISTFESIIFDSFIALKNYSLVVIFYFQIDEKSIIQQHHSQPQVTGQQQQQVQQINANQSTICAGKRQQSVSSSNLAQSSKSDSNNIIQPASAASSADEVEEINTKELAQRISAELKRYDIPQAIFAQRVLYRSQGTLSDSLRNPNPWSKLKSGRETFQRMYKWLKEPEFQRMFALRLARKNISNFFNFFLKKHEYFIQKSLECIEYLFCQLINPIKFLCTRLKFRSWCEIVTSFLNGNSITSTFQGADN